MHGIQIELFGGSHGIRDLGLLESAVHAPQGMFAGVFLYTDTLKMSAAYMYHLIKNHPFVDGNKRIGILAGLVFLKKNNIVCKLDNDQVYMLGMGIAESKLSQDAVVDILRQSIVGMS